MRILCNLLKLSLVLSLTGCAGTSLLEKDPRCPFEDRGGCQSVPSINYMIEHNLYTPDGNYVEQPHAIHQRLGQKKDMQIYVPGGVDKFGHRYPPKRYSEKMVESSR